MPAPHAPPDARLQHCWEIQCARATLLRGAQLQALQWPCGGHRHMQPLRISQYSSDKRLLSSTKCAQSAQSAMLGTLLRMTQLARGAWTSSRRDGRLACWLAAVVGWCGLWAVAGLDWTGLPRCPAAPLPAGPGRRCSPRRGVIGAPFERPPAAR